MNYVRLYEKNKAFYQKHLRLRKWLLIINKYLTLLFFGAYIAFWVYSVFAKTFVREDYVGLFVIPSVSLCLVSALRLVITRPRPYDVDGAGIEPLLPKARGKYSSTPSRHIASAVGIALGILPLSPVIGCVLLAASLLLAYTRFAVGVHYVGDLVFGGAIPLFVTVVYLTMVYFL